MAAGRIPSATAATPKQTSENIAASQPPKTFLKRGCQSVWRRSGDLPGMVAGDLEPGDVFTVDQPDPESPTRICLTNDDSKGLRFGFPNNKDFWCSMGSEVPVNLVK